MAQHSSACGIRQVTRMNEICQAVIIDNIHTHRVGFWPSISSCRERGYRRKTCTHYQLTNNTDKLIISPVQQCFWTNFPRPLLPGINSPVRVYACNFERDAAWCVHACLCIHLLLARPLRFVHAQSTSVQTH